MGDATTISIAMCTFNGAAWVGQQLQSLRTQTRMPDELIVCDDGSSDGTVDILEEFRRECPFPVRIVQNRQQLGVAPNFSQSIDLCSGSLIALADQDDLWGNQKLEVMERFLAANPHVGLAFCNARLVDEALNPIGTSLWDTLYLDPLQRSRLTNGQAVRVLTRTNVVTGATTMFRSRYKPLILPISPNWIHDGWIALMVAAVSYCAMVDEPLVDYRQHDRQAIGARKTGLFDQVQAGLEMDTRYFELEAKRWADAYARLSAHEHMLRYPRQDLQTLAEKAAFSRNRYVMRLHPDQRWEAINQHWHRGDYHQMAWGWKSLLQDVVIQQ